MFGKKYSNISDNRRLRFHHFLEDKIYSVMRKYGIKGSNRLGNIIQNVIPLPSIDGPVIVRTNLGFYMLVDPLKDHGLEKNIFAYGVYEKGTLNFLISILNLGDIFFDVGANIGLMSITAAIVVGTQGQIYSFEPLSEVYNVLQYNITLNQLKNVKTNKIALGSKEESRMIYEKPHISKGSASFLKTDNSLNGEQIQIQTVDKFISQNNIGKIKAIKIDVEGWELEVLKGATHLLSRRDAPIIIIEYSNMHPIYKGEQIDIFNFILNINNYDIYKLKRGNNAISSLYKISSPEKLPWHDNLFCFLPCHRERVGSHMF
jgi:FkbM family methyltransferase